MARRQRAMRAANRRPEQRGQILGITFVRVVFGGSSRRASRTTSLVSVYPSERTFEVTNFSQSFVRVMFKFVWGEATETSCTVYQRLLGGTPVLDHFFFGSEALATLRNPLPIRSQP